MPFISIIVPIYGVEAYLRQCLDSILEAREADIELIAVNDCSPDRCGEIIDEYASLDGRVRPVHLERNAGLGGARNAGLAVATGDYVWFVDSDDWLTPGALAAISARLRSLTPDVLVIDYARAYVDRRVRRNVLAHLLAAAPASFSLSEYAILLQNFGVAWNKVVRRDFLLSLGISFPDGWYEDIPFTYPVLAAAGRISVLDRVCLYYRQRRCGSILSSSSARHIELFDQYERAFAWLGPGAARDYLRSNVIGHGLLVLGAPGRVPLAGRPAFTARLASMRRRYDLHPKGFKERLLLAGGWRFRALKRLQLPRGSLSRKILRLPGLLMHWWHRRKPLQDIAIFSSYWGRAYECSPAAIDAAMASLAPGIRRVWTVTRAHVSRMPAGSEHVVIGSLAYYRILARAKWFFHNDNLEGDIVKRPGSVHVQTHHGTPLKRMGADEPGVDVEKLLKRCDRWDYSLSSSRYATSSWARAYPCRFETLEYGSPRNDVLAKAVWEPSSSLNVLYAPTFRPGFAAPSTLDLPGAVVTVKPHYFDFDSAQRVEDLMLRSDVLITDYSSIMFDFALLGRPIVIYAPDYSDYVASRGVYFDLLAAPPGPVAHSLSELRDIFASGEVWEHEERLKAFRERFCEFEDGRAAEKVVRRVIMGEAL